MTKSEQKQAGYMPSENLDKLLTEEFGDLGFSTTYAFISGVYVTKWSKEAPIELQKSIELYVKAFTAGNFELRERLSNKNNWL